MGGLRVVQLERLASRSDLEREAEHIPELRTLLAEKGR